MQNQGCLQSRVYTVFAAALDIHISFQTILCPSKEVILKYFQLIFKSIIEVLRKRPIKEDFALGLERILDKVNSLTSGGQRYSLSCLSNNF